MVRGDFVKIKSTGQQGILEFESTPTKIIIGNTVIQTNTVPTVLVLEDNELKHISAIEEDIEVIK